MDKFEGVPQAMEEAEQVEALTAVDGVQGKVRGELLEKIEQL